MARYPADFPIGVHPGDILREMLDERGVTQINLPWTAWAVAAPSMVRSHNAQLGAGAFIGHRITTRPLPPPQARPQYVDVRAADDRLHQ